MNKKNRYHNFNDYLFKQYRKRIQKISLDAGFGCPHKEGQDQRQGAGCIYCENTAFSPMSQPHPLPLEDQLALGIKYSRERFGADGFIAYFQSYTNTYGSLKDLKERYNIIRKFPDVVGLAVATRPDCISESVLDLLESFSEDYDVWLEIGLQSAHNQTLARIQRGHSVETFLQAVDQTSGRPINICPHVILGLPGEHHSNMMETAMILADLPIQGVKIHHCQIIQGTPLAEMYLKGEYRPLTLSVYLKYLCDFLEYLPWPITIQRLFGEAPLHLLLAPRWRLKKARLFEKIQQELARRDSHQGLSCLGSFQAQKETDCKGKKGINNKGLTNRICHP